MAGAIGHADSVSVICGRTSLADSANLTVQAIDALSSLDKVRFLPALRRGNVHGAIDMGMAPGMLPGRTSLDAAKSWFGQSWGSVPAAAGHDAAGILQQAAAGKIAVLFLLGADPLTDFPDPELAQAAIDGADLVVAIDPFINTSAAHGADLVLPAAAFGEVDGSHTNLEGRITAVRQKVTPPGTARPDWMIAAELAMRLGNDMGFSSVADITNEIAALSARHAGATAAAIDAADDGLMPDAAAESQAPAALAWTDLGPLTPAPAYDSYSFRLVVDRTMYDGGTQTTMCESIAELGRARVRYVSVPAKPPNSASHRAARCASAPNERRSKARSSSTSTLPPVSRLSPTIMRASMFVRLST